MTFTAILMALFGWTTWLFQFFFLAGWTLLKAVLWAMSPAWLWAAIIGVISGCLATPARAGWFWGPDPKIEAANRALEQAARIATDAARTQSSQQTQLLAAIEALSGERTEIAGELGRLGEMAARDSAWAAAVQAAGPVAVAVVVLALGCAAIWMITRGGNHDAQLATVLVDEITGAGSGILPGGSRWESLTVAVRERQPSLGFEDPLPDTEPQEMPF